MRRRSARPLLAAHGVEPLVYPAGFGSLPGYAFTKILGIDAFVTPYGNADEANHAPNENLTLDCFHNGIRTGAALLDQLGRARVAARGMIGRVATDRNQIMLQALGYIGIALRQA